MIKMTLLIAGGTIMLAALVSPSLHVAPQPPGARHPAPDTATGQQGEKPVVDTPMAQTGDTNAYQAPAMAQAYPTAASGGDHLVMTLQR